MDTSVRVAVMNFVVRWLLPTSNRQLSDGLVPSVVYVSCCWNWLRHESGSAEAEWTIFAFLGIVLSDARRSASERMMIAVGGALGLTSSSCRQHFLKWIVSDGGRVAAFVGQASASVPLVRGARLVQLAAACIRMPYALAVVCRWRVGAREGGGGDRSGGIAEETAAVPSSYASAAFRVLAAACLVADARAVLGALARARVRSRARF